MEIPEPSHLVTIETGQRHIRDFDLAGDDFLHLLVRQEGIDVSLQLIGPGGEILIEVDSPSGSRGLEELVAIPSRAGRYQLLVVAPKNAEPGKYSVQALEQRTATSADRRWVSADETFRRGRAQLKSKEFATARDALRSTLSTWQDLGLAYREAATLEQLGNALVQTEGPAAALEAFELAISWYLILDEDYQLATNLQKAASYHLQLGNAQRALDQLREALPIFTAQKNRRGESLCLARSGFANLLLGHPREALEHLRKGLSIAEDLGDPNLQASILTDTGKALLTLNQSQEALEKYLEAVDLYHRTASSPGLEIAMIGVANAALQLENPDRAESVLANVSSLLGPQASPRIRAGLLIAQSQLYRIRGDLDRARNVLETAQALTQNVNDPQLEADLLLSRGYLEVQAGAPERGLELYERAFQVFEQMDQKSGMASSRARAAEALLALKRPEEAWQRLEPALAEVERFRAATGQRDQRLSFFASYRQDYYELARDILLNLHLRHADAGFDRKAFELDERRRARELVESLAQKGGPSSEADTEKSTRRRREEALLQQLRKTVTDRPPNSAMEIRRLLAELQELRNEPSSLVPGSEAPNLSLEAAQHELLDDNTLILVYSLGRDRSVLWALSRKDLHYTFLPDRASIGARVRQFDNLLVRLSGHNESERQTTGRELSDILLAPVADILAERKLVIIADSELQILPFAALPEPGKSAPDDYILRHHDLSFLPSLSVLVQIRRLAREQPRNPRLAIFADPVFEAKDPRVSSAGEIPTTTGSSSRSQALARSAEDLRLGFPPARLPATRTEGQKIFELGDRKENLLALDFDASLEKFQRTDWKEFSVLHLATHALMHPQPELSGLLLALVDQEGKPREGFLPAVEISGMRLQLNLVVLSACQTGDGKAMRGEGILGLSWAFLDAGAARVISSLWKVQDVPTAELMIYFYEGFLQQDLPPAAALRRAQLKMADKPGVFPVVWAGFALHGDWR